MLAVHHHPELATPELRAWLCWNLRYDSDGRATKWLRENEPLGPELEYVARAICPGVPPAEFSVLLQAYRDGRAVTECHSDATGLGFILSLGATRTFRTHRVPDDQDARAGCGDQGLDVVEVQCINGTVLVMDEEFHRHHHHQVAPDPGVTGERLSLVFRTRAKETSCR